MRILLAPDSYKGSLTSPEVAAAMAEGARAAAPEAEIVQLPVSDGGDGTLDALVAATDAEVRRETVIGPRGDQVEARWLLLDGGRTAYVEMAEASGLALLPPERRDPKLTTTYGTGQLIQSALAARPARLLVGIGGSATNDGGAGMLQALGARLLDTDNDPLPPGGAALERLQTIELFDFQRPEAVEILVACDVTNPLLGPDGASAIYGPQKGATAADIELLDHALTGFADHVAAALGEDHRDDPGAGAAGGLGFGLVAFLGARLTRGIELVLDAIHFDDRLAGVDLALSGEGELNAQTVRFGKTLAGIGARCQKAGVPLLALAGGLGEDLADYRTVGITGAQSIIPRPMSLEEAMAQARPLTVDATRRLLEIFLAGRAAG